MKSFSLPGAGLILVATLAGCTGVTSSGGDGVPVIARPYDTGIDRTPLKNQTAGIVYDPDGCQSWIIDDGLEGYASRRRDPVSGLPICNNLYPSGTVIGQYRSSGIPDWRPR
jgi:hypothetical protein